MLDTPTSVTVIHGAMLSFETVTDRDADTAAVRVREQHETLLRVIDGIVTLEVAGAQRTLMLEGEARIEVGRPAPDLERRARRRADRAGVPPDSLGPLR